MFELHARASSTCWADAGQAHRILSLIGSRLVRRKRPARAGSRTGRRFRPRWPQWEAGLMPDGGAGVTVRNLVRQFQWGKGE
ncbi:hypothetical protein V6N12_063153 [Hibiscus sabdariffa]|uniref:Uncharacterized protein n=1 Tax=Hibiscus sabdariffa TaxID=183260 RepID=A0ABR2FAW5_9ROSI